MSTLCSGELKILDITKLKGFADDKLSVTKMTISFFDRVENTVRKGENAGYQHFLLFRQRFPKPSSLGLLKVGNVWYRVNASAKASTTLTISATSITSSGVWTGLQFCPPLQGL